jgi:hypothetical protein
MLMIAVLLNSVGLQNVPAALGKALEIELIVLAQIAEENMKGQLREGY